MGEKRLTQSRGDAKKKELFWFSSTLLLCVEFLTMGEMIDAKPRGRKKANIFFLSLRLCALALNSRVAQAQSQSCVNAISELRERNLRVMIGMVIAPLSGSLSNLIWLCREHPK
jgi:hypothetical protein